MTKTRVNYLLDLVIGIAFIISAVTGIAFLFMGSGGYQGGRNLGFATAFLGISRAKWSDLHTLGSLIMIAGVSIHLALHWKWIVCITQQWLKDLPKFKRSPQEEESCPVTA